FITNRKTNSEWKSHLPIHIIGLLLCLTILIITSYEKFTEGGWLTFIITASVILICYLIRKHYNKVRKAIKRLDESINTAEFPSTQYNNEQVKPQDRTAIQLVSGFNSLGIHTLLSLLHNFPGLYKNIVFISVSAVDTDSFKDKEYLKQHEESTKKALEKYVDYARRLGVSATYRYDIGTDVIELVTKLCIDVSKEFQNSTIFAGKLTFQQEKFYHKLLHNDTSLVVQKNLQHYGITTVIMPVHVEL
ncbi:MAG: KUP/HAK/KT family potassium transporter, partial [Pseudomonadota bacterium]